MLILTLDVETGMSWGEGYRFEPNRLYWDFSGLCFANNKPKSALFKAWHCGHTTPFSQQTSHYCEKRMVCFRMQEECQLCASTACVDAPEHNLRLYNGSAKKSLYHRPYSTFVLPSTQCVLTRCMMLSRGERWWLYLRLSATLVTRSASPVQLCCSNGEERRWFGSKNCSQRTCWY